MGCSGSKPEDTELGGTAAEAPKMPPKTPKKPAATPTRSDAEPMELMTGPTTPMRPAADPGTPGAAPTPNLPATPAALEDIALEEAAEEEVSALAAAPAADPEPPAVDWAAVDWKEKLSAEEFRVLREKKTEARGGEYDMFYPPEGYFICRGCGSALFSADAKFKSGCGWPSFDRCYTGSVRLEADLSHGMQRRELVCATCNGHLGHLFSGEKATDIDQRHCVNTMSIKFVKAPPPETLVENGEALDTTAVDKLLQAAGPSAGGQGAASVKPPSDLDLSEPGLAADWAAARAWERGWCLCSYAVDSKAKIVPVSKGDGGFDELRAALRERQDAVNYAAAATTVDGRLRFVFLCYIGESTSAIKRGRAAMHAPHMEKFFDGTVGAIPVLTSSDELENAHVNGLLKQLCKGSKEAVIR